MSQFKTPLRYPGGKQKVWPFIQEILAANGLLGGNYAEPFAGGAGVAIELLLRDLVTRIYLNDACIGVYSFWRSVLDEPERLCNRISLASLTVDEWKRQREIYRTRSTADRFDLGFAFLYLNRCNRSGILTGGLIGGLSQRGEWKMDARFPRNTLIERIEAIATKSKQVRLRNDDAETFLKKHIPRLGPKTFVYCDPPYFEKGKRLYPNSYLPRDHERLAEVIQSVIKHPWAVSYDACEDIFSHYSQRRSIVYSLQYNAAKAYQGSEFFVFSDELCIPASSRIDSIQRSLIQLSEAG
jgi:DNA adenine methylase